MRTSPVHYIAPSALSIIPNANESQRDLAVNVAKNTKIKVCYQPIADLAYDNANYKEWTLRGRNRRLADADVPYTIYARLKKNDRTDGYLVFAQQIQDEVTSEWQDPYILTPNTSTTSPMRVEGADGEKYLWAAIPDRQATQNRTAYWWVKLGTVSQADSSGKRSVSLDTGILGTDQYNMDWYLDPDKMPERPLRVVYMERGEWTDAPTVVYTGTSGEMKPDGTLDADTATILGWTGSKTLSFKQGQTISEPYHYRHLTRCRWLTHRLAEYNNGYTDQELFDRLNKPTRGWEEENWVETSRVWWNDKLWECLTEGATDEPSQESPNWKLLLQGGEDAVNVELTKSADAVVIDPSGNIVGGYRTVSKDSSQNEFYTYRFFTSATVMRGGNYLHLCGAMDDNEELGEGNFTIEAVGAGCDLKVEGTTVYITSIWHCNDGDAGTDPYTSYNRTPEEYQQMRAMTEAVAHITLNIEGKTAVTKDYRLQLVHLPTDTITLESHNEVAALNWSTKRNAWTNLQDIVIPLTASSGGQPVMFQTVNGGTAPDIRLLNKPGWLSGTPGYSVAWADYDEDGDGHAEYTASQHMSVEITIPIANILRTWMENNATQEIPTTNLLKFNVTTIVDGVEYESVVPFTLNVTTDKAIYILAPSVRQVTGTMIGGTWDSLTNTISNARYSYVAAGEACDRVTCRLMCYDQNDNLTEITSASAIHDNLTFFINGQASTLEGFRTTGVQNTAVAGKDYNLFDELSEIVFAIKMDGRDYESEGVPILRNGANISVGDDGNWYIGGVNTEVFAKGTKVTDTTIYYTDPMDASTPPAYSPATDADRGKPVSPYQKTACPASVEGKFIHYVSITVFSDSEETYVYSYGTIGTGNTITVIHDRDFFASSSELTQAQLREIGNASWSESTPSDYSSINKYLYSRDTARYYKNGVEQNITVGGISYPRIVYTMLAYWGQDGSGVEFAYYRAEDDSAANKPTADVLNQRHAGTAKNPVIADWNGSDGGWYDDNPGFTTQGQVMYQSVNKYINGTWSGWGDPVIIERYGQNSVRLDIDNEMDTVESDSTGKVTVARTVETVVRLYDGATEVDISSATLSVNGGPGSSIATKSFAAAGKGKKLSLAFIAGQTMADCYNISIYYTYNGTTYYATLTITASKGQAVWQLKPSQSSIVYSRQSNNTLSSADNTLTLDVLKLDRGSTDTKPATKANLTAWGLNIRYSTSSMPGSTTEGSAWPAGNSLTVASTTDNVHIAMFNSAGTLIDRETVPVIKDGLNGTDGQNSVRLDIDNEMDTVESDSTGKITVARTVETVVRLYDGATEVDISSATLSVNGGPGSSIATKSFAAAGKGRKLSLAFIAGKTMADCYNISIYYTYNGTTYYATLTITASKGQAVWQLKPSQSSIVYSRQSNNTLSSADNTLTLDVLKLDRGSTDTKPATKANLTAWGLNIRYSTSSMPGSTTEGSAWPAGNSLTVASTTDNVHIAMFNSAGTLIDRETVPVIKDGLNGTNGKDGVDGNDGKDGKYEEKQFCRSAAATSTNGSTPPTNVDTSYGSAGWSDTPPITTIQYPFIWQRTRIFDPNTNTATSWVYVRLTGKDGEDGAPGKAGLWYAYAGIWGTDTSSVTNTETQGWYVQYNGGWYMNVKAAGSANTTTPGGNGWADMSSAFKYYIAEAYFGNYAHLGSFIINGDWMISQYGTLYDSSGSATTVGAGNYQTSYGGKVPYAWFNPSYPTSNQPGSYNFCPNFAVDGKTGRTYQQDAYIKGEVHATSGNIGGIVLGPDAWGGATLANNGIGFNPRYFFLKGDYGHVEMFPYASTRIEGANTCILAATSFFAEEPAIKAYGKNTASGKGLALFADGDIKLTGNFLDGNGNIISFGSTNYTFNTNQFAVSNQNVVSLKDSFSVSGTITAYTFSLSDERLKIIKGKIELSVYDIAKARSVLFVLKKDKDKRVQGGVIAQDWEKKAPWALKKEDDGTYSVNYPSLAMASTIECAREIVELKKENKELRDILKSISDELTELKKEIKALKEDRG